jgi:DNA-binding CsgD family transcriptional regulator
MPSADRAQRDAFVAYQRATADAEQAARALAAVYEFDVSGRLAEVRAPTVVLHRREDRAIPFACGRELAAGVPGASFVALEGADHYPWLGDADAVVRADLRALGVEGRGPAPPPRTPEPAPDGEDLTERETEILTLVAAGLSDREIAERLVLSPHTVHRHVANVRTKLGLPTRAAAVAAATRRGLL